jgi:hypothetical protein
MSRDLLRGLIDSRLLVPGGIDEYFRRQQTQMTRDELPALPWVTGSLPWIDAGQSARARSAWSGSASMIQHSDTLSPRTW